MLQDALTQAVGVLVTYGLCLGYFPLCVIVIPAIVADFPNPKHDYFAIHHIYLGLYSASLHRCNIDASNLFLNFASDQIVPPKLCACKHDTLILVVKQQSTPPPRAVFCSMFSNKVKQHYVYVVLFLRYHLIGWLLSSSP